MIDMKKSIFVLAMAVIAVSCAKNEEVAELLQELECGFNQFSAVTSDNTKVTINSDWSLSWETGDAVNVNDGTVTTCFNSLGSGSNTVLSSDGYEIDPAKTYFAVYPASEVNAFSEGRVILSVPSEQEAVPGEYPECAAVAVTTGQERNFIFKNVCALVSFELTEADIRRIVLFGGGEEYVSGEIEVGCDDASFSVRNGSKAVTLYKTDESGKDAVLPQGRYYVAILPGTYSYGLSLSIYKSDGSRVRRNLTLGASSTIGRSKYVDLERMDEGRTWRTEYTIKNGQELVAFLSVADQCPSETVVSLANDIDMTGCTGSASSFAGTFDGGNFSLKNWNSSSPVFSVVKSGAVIKNLKIDETCSLTATEKGGNIAPVAGINHGTISACVNNAGITAVVDDADCLVGGIAALSDGLIVGCSNTGAIDVSGTASGVGGIVGRYDGVSGTASLTGCENYGALKVQGKIPAVSGIVARGRKGDLTSCINWGTVTVNAFAGADSLHVGGIGATLSGSVSDCTNNAAVKIEKNNAGRSFIGGVIGECSVSYARISNNANVSVTLGSSGGQVMMAGVAGYMDNGTATTANNINLPSNLLVTGQNKGKVVLSGGSGNSSTAVFYVAGIVGNTTIPEVASKNTSWATCNTNYGDIEVNVPLTVYVGGIYGQVLGKGVYADTRNVCGARNGGSIKVTNPGKNSCVGGVIARHGRGQLGNANAFGQSSKPASIVVSGADETTSVGAYAGYVSSDNGGKYPACCMYLSGFSCYGSIDAPGTKAGVIVGRAVFTGSSSTNGVMLGSNTSELLKVSKKFVFNGVTIEDVSSFDIDTFFGGIFPSNTTTRTKTDTDATPLKGIYFIRYGKQSGEASYTDGIINVD